MTASAEPHDDDRPPEVGLASAGGGRKELTEAEREQRRRASQAAAEKRKGRPAGAPPEAGRLREPLVKIGEWVKLRDPELGTVLVEDAPKIATLLVKWANASWAPPGFVAVIRAAASALEPIDAFGRVLRVLFQRVFDRRGRRQAPAVDGFAEPVYADTPPPEPEPAPAPSPLEAFEDEHRSGPTGTPDRFRADVEPPPAE